jgi:GNAT superfamily N-acetyltransferase
MKFNELYDILFESRFSDREYYDKDAAWKLTPDEYLKITNKSDKFHGYESYQPRETKILDNDPNPPIEVNVRPSYTKGWVDVSWTLKDGTRGGRGRVSPYEVETEKDKFKFAQSWSESPKTYKTIKDKYWYSMADHGYTVKDFPYKIQSINGIDYRIRKEKQQYSKKNEDGDYMRDADNNIINYSDEEIKQKKLKPSDVTVAAFDKNEIVGMATDEWGALLVTVQPQHRGQGIGVNLSHLYRTIYPRKDSGGYTSQGKQMALRVHKKAINDAKKLGWYERGIKEGIISKEKAEKILSQI